MYTYIKKTVFFMMMFHSVENQWYWGNAMYVVLTLVDKVMYCEKTTKKQEGELYVSCAVSV